jgi:hypothetical protein
MIVFLAALLWGGYQVINKARSKPRVLPHLQPFHGPKLTLSL